MHQLNNILYIFQKRRCVQGVIMKIHMGIIYQTFNEHRFTFFAMNTRHDVQRHTQNGEQFAQDFWFLILLTEFQ